MDFAGIIILIVSFFLLLTVGVPVAYSIGISGILTMLVSIDSLPAFTTYALRMASGLDSFALLAIPFFILAGNIMNSGGIAIRLIDFAKVLVGKMPGGLAVVNVVSNMLFGAISGSAAAAASAIGSIMTPEMKKAGYDTNFSAAVNISSATTGMIIPPSNVLIVYSLASGGVSVSALFMAGYLPGILTGLAIMLVAAFMAAHRHYERGVSVNISEGMRVFWRAIPSLMLLVIVIGGILAGFFTATEASAVAVLYSLLLAFIYKELTWKKLPTILLQSAKTTAIVMLLVGTCTGLSWIMSYENLPQTVSSMLLSISSDPTMILIMINIILLIVGIFMDMTPAVLIFTPIFLPIATQQLGMDPVHFGIMMVLNLCVGLCTPPVGSVLFIGCSVAGTKIDKVIKPLLPMFAAMIVVLFLVAFIPQLSLLIPKLFGL
jgi:tripartite ATP-independent transporter DctM subunit